MEAISADAKAKPAEEPRRLAIFIDGTWNVEDNNTNVWRLYSLCVAHGDASKQMCFYTKGVGTAYGSKMKGGVLGMGFTQILRQAYDWIISHYKKDDKIFIFGFSRGAYAARSLAGLIARCGIPTTGSPIGVDEIYKRYEKGGSPRTLHKLLADYAADPSGNFELFEEWMISHCVAADIHMVGVWDTVGSLIGAYNYLETGLRQPIKNIFHAMAIDEHRYHFRPTLLTFNRYSDQAPADKIKPRDITVVEQRWFVGAHANVGGGYASDPINQAPLSWIAGKAAALGLQMGEAVQLDAHPWTYSVADSFRDFAFHLYQIPFLGIPYMRKVGEPDRTSGTKTTENVNETIDSSVFERWRQDKKYRPRNLKTWAKLYGVDPAKITFSVMARDPKTLAPK